MIFFCILCPYPILNQDILVCSELYIIGIMFYDRHLFSLYNLFVPIVELILILAFLCGAGD